MNSIFEQISAALRSLESEDSILAYAEEGSCLRVSRLAAGETAWTAGEQQHLDQCLQCQGRAKSLGVLPHREPILGDGFICAGSAPDPWALQIPDINFQISEEGIRIQAVPFILITHLSDTLSSRRIETGRLFINDNEAILRAIQASSAEIPRLFYVLASWAEYSGLAAEIAIKLDFKYRQQPCPEFSWLDYGWAEAGKAWVAVYENRDSEVDAAWQSVHDHSPRLTSYELLATLDFAKARSLMRRARYSSALEAAHAAILHFDEAGLPGMTAAVRTIESRLLMELGQARAAEQCWTAAYGYLQTTEDYTLLGNLIFSQARRYCRMDFDREAYQAFEEAVFFYQRYKPYHRTLRRVFLEWAGLEHRMASKAGLEVEALDWSNSAAYHIERARELLETDATDVRNTSRLLLTCADQSLFTSHPKLYLARSQARKAYKFAEKQNDRLMQARARYKQAIIEHRTAENEQCDNPLRTRLQALRYADDGLALVCSFHHRRLRARFHLLRGRIFLDFPFCDPLLATREWEKAAECMEPYDELDYLVKQIKELEERLGSYGSDYKKPSIVSITAEKAFSQPLALTIEGVERAIIRAAVNLFGGNVRVIASVLQTGRQKVDKYLSEKFHGNPVMDRESENVIFRVTGAMAFSKPLHFTIQEVERSIILDCLVRFRGSPSVWKLLQINSRNVEECIQDNAGDP